MVISGGDPDTGKVPSVNHEPAVVAWPGSLTPPRNRERLTAELRRTRSQMVRWMMCTVLLTPVPLLTLDTW